MNARLTFLGVLSAALLGAACSEQSVTVELRSLSASGDVSYVCRDAQGNGVALSECSAGGLYSGRNELYALVTQTSTGEVAVINVPYDMDNRDDDEGVVDVDPSSPGYGFLRVGAQPVDIVSMPAGQASFVASAEPGRMGIYGLPTSCVDKPLAHEPPRDLTTWPACRLAVAPGGIALIQGECDVSTPNEDAGNACVHGLDAERDSGKCTKLVVSQPDSSSLLVIDVRTLLDQPQGSFGWCADLGTATEAAADDTTEVPLSVSLPAVPIQPKLPADLNTGCPPIPLPVPAPGPVEVARPARIEASESTLYVADQSAPVIHVLEMDAAGVLREAPPLLPSSYWAPQRNVTVSRMAVSPLTPSGKRWLYAVDELDWPTASLMAFDVSPGSTERTPHLRERSTKVPDQPPDRVTFAAALRDVAFVMRDRPEFGDSGVALLGELCEPDPAKSAEPGALYRPNVDRDTGARPYKLRGLFGMAMLSDGTVSVIDVEDFDAPCRRPVEVSEDNGCEATAAPASAETVTGEVSCRMVEPHTPRAARLAINDNNSATAPSLRSLPTLTVPAEARQVDVATRPKLLAVSSLPRVWVGSTLYDEAGTRGPRLDLSPATATDNALALPYADIRAYRGIEELTLEFEGPISIRYETGFLQRTDDGGMVLNDANALYCDAGVSDRELMAELGERRFQKTGASAAEFGEAFGDHIVITADFPGEDDRYWPHRTELVPGDASSELTCTRDSCEAYFGELPDRFRATELDETRQFEIVDAEQQHLVLEERFYTARRRVASPADVALLDEQRNRHLAMAECCFPEGSSYEVHASKHWSMWSTTWGFRHDVVARSETENGRTVIECRHDCDPRKEGFQSRVFEIAFDCDPSTDASCPTHASADVNACVTSGRRPVSEDEAAWACVHQTPTARFALYQGTLQSYPGMYFSWQVLGGYSPMVFNLRSLATFVSPQAVVNLPDLDRLSIVDASTLGLTMVSLDGLRPLIPTLN
ncbi:MAG: hypothetical protein M3020_19315 [Myxococcota bacterium]|nr:hypothetical protein [Myxococcota bacterium]